MSSEVTQQVNLMTCTSKVATLNFVYMLSNHTYRMRDTYSMFMSCISNSQYSFLIHKRTNSIMYNDNVNIWTNCVQLFY